jgi:putative ABC transport system permease protein
LTFTLLAAHWRRHWLRTLIGLGALVTSVAMVIVVVGGQDVAMAQVELASAKAADALGRFDLIVLAGPSSEVEAARRQFGVRPPLPGMSEYILKWLGSDDDVQALVECCEMGIEAGPPGKMFREAAYRPGQLVTCPLLATSSTEPPYPLAMGRWIDGSGDEIVIDVSQAWRLVPSKSSSPRRPGMRMGPFGQAPAPPEETVGSTFQLITETGRRDVRICGVIKMPFADRSLTGMYISPAAFERLTGHKPCTNRVLVDLTDGVEVEDFAERLQQAAGRAGESVCIETAEDYQARAGRFGMMGRRRGGAGFFPLLRNASMNLAILTAMFIIFSTLNMGLQERSRQLAVLRAVGMTRDQVVGLIAWEVFSLALVGWLVGVAVGWGLMRQSIAAMPSLQGRQVPLHVGLWLGLGALTAFGATFAAALLPAMLAARRRPLEGMGGSPMLRSKALPVWLAPAGLVLIAANPILSLTPLVPEPWRTTIGLPLGCLGAIIGFAMLMPLLVLTCERLFGRIAALVFGLSRRLLSRQLSAGLWRTVGCATALMVGLGLYVTVQVWGQSMLRPFLLTSRSPDAIVTIMPDGVPESRLGAVARLKGVESFVPMILRYPDVTNLPASVHVGGIFSREMIYVGCDVRKMIDRDTGMMTASFVRGDAGRAYAELAKGGACLITDSLYLRAPQQFDVGQKIVLDTPDGAASEAEHTIAGVIEMPGWHLLTKSSQMRRGMERVGGLVIVPVATARAVFPDATYKTFWFQLSPGTEASSLELPMIRVVDPNAAPMRPASQPASRPAPERRIAADPGSAGGPGGFGGRRGGGLGRGRRPAGGPGAMIDSPYYCRVTDTRAMTDAIRARAEGIIDSMTIYPLLALGLSALAVVGTMMTSVRVRNWEIGILRSIGMTRWQLLRQILAEGMLIGLLACVVSLLFGMLASWTGIRSSSAFWGVSAPYVIPWGRVLLGIGAAVVLCLISSVWPAVMAARRRPLRLLQDGRTME